MKLFFTIQLTVLSDRNTLSLTQKFGPFFTGVRENGKPFTWVETDATVQIGSSYNFHIHIIII